MTAAWTSLRLVAFDVETTGTDPEQARIVTATVALVGGGLATEAFSTIVNPGIEIPDEATAVHGISTEQARLQGQEPKVALPAIVAALRPVHTARYPLVIFNARYDLTVLDRELRRRGFPRLDLGGVCVIDPYVVDKHLDRYRRGSRKLDAICAHYGAKLEEAHDATSDAVAAARVAWVIGRRGQVVRRVRNGSDQRELDDLREQWSRVREDLTLLHGAQVGWAAEQARGLAEYFASKGEPQHVETAWPLVPWREEAQAA